MRAFVATHRDQSRTSTTILTTLYDLMEAFYSKSEPMEEALVVKTVMHLLRSGRITFLRTTEGCMYE
jgi:hypothetical protein